MDISQTGVHVSLTNYASAVILEHCLLEKFSVADAQQAVDDVLQIGNGTRTDKALKAAAACARAEGRENVPQVIVVVTDGASDSRSRTKKVATDLKDEGFIIISVGIGTAAVSGNNKDKFLQELDDMASPPVSENSFFVDGFEKLIAFTNRLALAICEQGKKY